MRSTEHGSLNGSLYCWLNDSLQRLTAVAAWTAFVTMTALALAVTAARPGYGQPPASSPPSTVGLSPAGPAGSALGASERGRVVLFNASVQRVRVEVRVGSAERCEENPLVAVRTLHRGRRWTVRTQEPVCWRREQVPGDASGTWTPWARRTVGTRQVHVERVL